MRGLILSAGLGERLRPLTLKRAKPAIEFLNIPMLAYPYHWLDQTDLTDVVFNTHYLPESIRQAAMHVVRPSTQIHFTHEEAILGSGGGIWNARFYLQGDDHFAVANGDGVVLFEEPDALERMLREHRRSGALATLLVCPLEGVGTRIPGVWIDKYDEVRNFGKSPDANHLECLHYASYMFISKRIWDYLPEGPSNILYDVFMTATRAGEKIHAHRVDKMRWFETGNIAEYLQATRACLELLAQNGAYARGLKELLERFHAYNPAKSAVNLLAADSSGWDNTTHFKGFNVVGAEARLANADLENCVILPRASVTGRHSDTVLV